MGQELNSKIKYSNEFVNNKNINYRFWSYYNSIISNQLIQILYADNIGTNVIKIFLDF